jgi:hypothetical protein
LVKWELPPFHPINYSPFFKTADGSMSTPQEPPQVKLIAGLLFVDSEVRDRALEVLFKRFGPPDFLTETQPFTYTPYYNLEMGTNILRQVCSFLHLVGAENLPDIKLFTNQLEDQLSRNGKRQINIDPGFLSDERVILATGKNYTHRIYLRNGIYADLTLLYQKGAYQKLPWTYPDFQEPALLHFFGVLREKLRFQRHGGLPTRHWHEYKSELTAETQR